MVGLSIPADKEDMAKKRTESGKFGLNSRPIPVRRYRRPADLSAIPITPVPITVVAISVITIVIPSFRVDRMPALEIIPAEMPRDIAMIFVIAEIIEIAAGPPIAAAIRPIIAVVIDGHIARRAVTIRPIDASRQDQGRQRPNQYRRHISHIVLHREKRDIDTLMLTREKRFRR